MNPKRRITLADVAAAAGVSKMSASRALRGAGDVTADKIARVRQAAKDLGYIGNQSAASLSGNRSDLIGVVVPSVANVVFAEVLAGIAEGLMGQGKQPVFGVTDYDADKEYDIIRNMLSWNPTGMIVTGVDQPPDTVHLLRNAGVPVVQIMDTDGDAVDACIGFSHHAAGLEMGRALIAQGRRHFAFVGSDIQRDTRARKRLAGFEAALAEAGLTLMHRESASGPSTTSAGSELTAATFAAQPWTDCIYYSNDDLAAGGAFHCMALGIAIPGQVLLAGFNGLEFVQSLPVPLATSHTPRHAIGRAAAATVLGQDSQKVRVLSPQLDLGPGPFPTVPRPL